MQREGRGVSAGSNLIICVSSPFIILSHVEGGLVETGWVNQLRRCASSEDRRQEISNVSDFLEYGG